MFVQFRLEHLFYTLLEKIIKESMKLFLGFELFEEVFRKKALRFVGVLFHKINCIKSYEISRA
jgi:hypothetical protein